MQLNSRAIYVLLVLFISAGVLIDSYIWPKGVPSNFTANDFIQLVGIIVLSWQWQLADAKERGITRSHLSAVATIIFVPIGTAIYLFQSRTWTAATLTFCAYWGGIVLAILLSSFLAASLIAGR